MRLRRDLAERLHRRSVVKVLEEQRVGIFDLVGGHGNPIAGPDQYIAPFTGCPWGVFPDNGCTPFIIYDDLSKQAVAYRQVALAAPPAGPEAYPARVLSAIPLLERAPAQQDACADRAPSLR